MALGTSAHAIGTSKALQMGEIEGAMSGLAIAVAGIMTAILAPVAANFCRKRTAAVRLGVPDAPRRGQDPSLQSDH
ncbi:MAG: LrgB family protein [Gemmiger formicilis]